MIFWCTRIVVSLLGVDVVLECGLGGMSGNSICERYIYDLGEFLEPELYVDILIVMKVVSSCILFQMTLHFQNIMLISPMFGSELIYNCHNNGISFINEIMLFLVRWK